MIKENSLGSRSFDVLNFLFLTALTSLFVLPFIYLFSVSISDPVPVALNQVRLVPIGFSVEAYRVVLRSRDLGVAYYNSIRFTVVGTLLSLAVTTLASYALAQGRRMRYRGVFTVLFMVTMFFSGGLIPTFLNMQKLKLIDTMWAIVLPGAASFWNIIIMRTNFQSIPSELYESAFIDGASDWRIYFAIVLPLSKAIIATISLFVGVGLWNSYFGPLMYLNSNYMQPLTILLRRILVANEVFAESEVMGAIGGGNPLIYSGRSISVRMATIFVSIGPIILTYPFAQKYFVKGQLVGSVKG